MTYGYPKIGFWSDNGGEFRNSKMEEFVNKLGFKIKLMLAFSPWSNGINERNHYNCDVIITKKNGKRQESWTWRSSGHDKLDTQY